MTEPLIWTPATIRAFMDETRRAFVSAVEQARTAASDPHVPVDSLNRLSALTRDFDAWYRENYASTWSTLWGSTVDTAKRFSDDLRARQAELERYGVRFPVAAPIPGEPIARTLAPVLKWAAVLAGLYLAGRYVLPHVERGLRARRLQKVHP